VAKIRTAEVTRAGDVHPFAAAARL
jgi:hypothetical protein